MPHRRLAAARYAPASTPGGHAGEIRSESNHGVEQRAHRRGKRSRGGGGGGSRGKLGEIVPICASLGSVGGWNFLPNKANLLFVLFGLIEIGGRWRV